MLGKGPPDAPSHGSHQPIGVIIEFSSSVTKLRRGRANQADGPGGAGGAEDLGLKWRSCLIRGLLYLVRGLPSSPAHQEMRRTARSPATDLFPWQMSHRPVKTDDKSNNMRCNHQGYPAFSIPHLHPPHPPIPFKEKNPLMCLFISTC